MTAGSLLYRVHRTDKGPIFFGQSSDCRFDDPKKGYGVLYAAKVPDLAFAETLLRGPGTIVATSEIEIRSLCVLEVIRDIHLVQLHGPSMFSLDADASVTAGSYDLSQAWSRAIHEHPSEVDGIAYRGTRDNSEIAIALFDRSNTKIAALSSAPLLNDKVLLGRILDRYRAGIF